MERHPLTPGSKDSGDPQVSPQPRGVAGTGDLSGKAVCSQDWAGASVRRAGKMDVSAWTSAERLEAGSTVCVHVSELLTEERQDCQVQGSPQPLPCCSITTEAPRPGALLPWLHRHTEPAGGARGLAEDGQCPPSSRPRGGRSKHPKGPPSWQPGVLPEEPAPKGQPAGHSQQGCGGLWRAGAVDSLKHSPSGSEQCWPSPKRICVPK